MNASNTFQFSDFSKIAALPESGFGSFGTVVSQGKEEGSTYTFKDNGSNVLAVAHLDTVQQASWSNLIKANRERVLLCPRLDDRLGVYIILSLLPKLGITCDWLLTTGEEVGCSSAELFRTEKQYNWAFSFDRAGSDVVMYHYECKALRKVMRKAGFRVGDGSFSDLSVLDIGCSGINFGCGYHDCHSLGAYAILSETFRMVDLFRRFYARNKDTVLPYDPSARWESMRYWNTSRGYQPHSIHGYGSNHGAYSYWDGKTYRETYPADEAMWSGHDAERDKRDYMTATDRAYLEWMNEYHQQGLNGSDIIEDIADRAQGGDNGR